MGWGVPWALGQLVPCPNPFLSVGLLQPLPRPQRPPELMCFVLLAEGEGGEPPTAVEGRGLAFLSPSLRPPHVGRGQLGRSCCLHSKEGDGEGDTGVEGHSRHRVTWQQACWQQCINGDVHPAVTTAQASLTCEFCLNIPDTCNTTKCRKDCRAHWRSRWEDQGPPFSTLHASFPSEAVSAALPLGAAEINKVWGQTKETIRRAMSKLHQIFMDLSIGLGSAVPSPIIQVPHMQPGAAGKTADLF